MNRADAELALRNILGSRYDPDEGEQILELIADAWDEGIGQCCEVCFPPDNPYQKPS